MAVKWILSDVDGCLSPEESEPWDVEHFMEFARVVRDASAGKGKVAPLTLCTGRPQPYVEVLVKLLDIRAPVICENGAVFYTLHDNHAWFSRSITQQKLLGLREVRAYLEAEVLPAHPGTLLQFGKEAQISVFSEEPTRLTPVALKIGEFVAKHGGPDLVINASHYYLNVSLEGVNKGAAIVELVEMLGAGRQELAGIGDTEGDLPLREAVFFFACPANAREAVKKAADYVSPKPLLSGVLDILGSKQVERG